MRRATIFFATAVAALALAVPGRARGEDRIHACIDASTNGQTMRKAGKLLAARQEMIACARDACPAIVRSHCAAWLSEVEGMIPTIVVRAQDASGADQVDARVTIDGEPGKLDGQPVPLDPGEHIVTVANPRGATLESRVLLVAGERSRLVALHFPAEHASSPGQPPDAGAHASTRVPTGAWILGGAGLAAIGAGAYFAIAASHELNHLDATCSPNCTNAQTAPGRTDQLTDQILFGVGGAAVAVALVWALAFPQRTTPPPAAAQLEITPLPRGAMTALTIRY
jgi:hypothetical protein